MILPNLRRATPAEYVPAPVAQPVPSQLPEALRDRVALALHQRWHGERTTDHPTSPSETTCALLAGAYDDVAAIEHILLELLGGAPA